MAEMAVTRFMAGPFAKQMPRFRVPFPLVTATVGTLRSNMCVGAVCSRALSRQLGSRVPHDLPPRVATAFTAAARCGFQRPARLEQRIEVLAQPIVDLAVTIDRPLQERAADHRLDSAR